MVFHPNQPSPTVAFNMAIAKGILSSSPKASNYAGHFMFMGRYEDGRLGFKHCDSRQYLWVTP